MYANTHLPIYTDVTNIQKIHVWLISDNSTSNPVQTKKYRKKRKFFRDSIFFKKYDLYLHP